MRTKKKKKRIKLKSFLLVIFIIGLIGLLGYQYCELHIKNIYVVGNNLLKEIDIIEEANLINYPKIIDVSCHNIEQKLLKNDLINEVKVTKTILGKITININENKLLYKKDNNYMLSNGKIISLEKEYDGIPQLINEIDDDILKKCLPQLELINEDIYHKISEIEYAKTDLDKERFLFYMNDGNEVYITLSKIKAINNYNEIYPTLGNNIGILYLDSGNHFQIKKAK